jgi:hypothetical protein
MPRLDLPALEAAFQLIRSRKFAPLMPNGSTITGRSQDRPSVFPCWSAIGLLDKFGASKESEYLLHSRMNPESPSLSWKILLSGYTVCLQA